MGKIYYFIGVVLCISFVGACTPKTPDPIGKEPVFNKLGDSGSCDSGYQYDSEVNLCLPEEEVCEDHDYSCEPFPPDGCGSGFEFNSQLGYCVPANDDNDNDNDNDNDGGGSGP